MQLCGPNAPEGTGDCVSPMQPANIRQEQRTASTPAVEALRLQKYSIVKHIRIDVYTHARLALAISEWTF